MDITRRINLLLGTLLTILCVLLADEAFFGKRVQKFLVSPSSVVREYKQARLKTRFEKQSSQSISEDLFKGAEGTDISALTPSSKTQSAPVLEGGGREASAKALYLGEFGDIKTEPSSLSLISFTRVSREGLFALPEGFYSAKTNSYLVYREQLDITPQLRTFLEELHGDLVLDIMPFSLFTKFDRVFLMLFRTKNAYTKYTDKPSWSIASADVGNNAVFILENYNFAGNLVHEMTHLYFDGFFYPKISPLWLSEGFAVYMQSFAQDDKSNAWLRREVKGFQKGRYLDFAEFSSANNLSFYGEQDILSWYAQAYSVVNYLLTSKTKDEFYQFSDNLRKGMPVGRALYRAYGMPFNTLSALEFAWQAQLQGANLPSHDAFVFNNAEGKNEGR